MIRNKKIAILAIIAMVMMMMPVSLFASTADKTRIAGDTRVGTSLATCDAGWTSSTVAVVAPSDQANLVDSLTAASLAGQVNAPILITTKTALDAGVKAKLVSLGVTKVYAIGALSDSVVAELTAMSGVTVVRLAGASRWATADAVNAQLTGVVGTFVVGYNSVADALSIASYAAANHFAIVLTKADGTVDASKIVGSTVYLIGGTAVVKDYAGATRIAGADRFATNKAVVDTLTFNLDKVYVANGFSLVDALAAAPLAAQTKSPILLTDGTTIPAMSSDKLKDKVGMLIALGGTAAVSDAVKNSLTNAGPITSITSVAGVSGKFYDINKDTQTLAFTVNGGRTISVDDVYALGYEIEFDTSEAVFDDGGNVDYSKSGDLDSAAMKNVYDSGNSENNVSYTVAITKNGDAVAESSSVNFSLVNGDDTAASAIQSYKIYRDANDGTVYTNEEMTGTQTVPENTSRLIASNEEIQITSGTLVLGENYIVDDVIADTANGDKNVNVTTSVSLKTSDADVADVQDNIIQPTGEGTAKITIVSGSTEKTFSVTVKDATRKAAHAIVVGDTIKVSKASEGFARNAIIIFDQFGDPFYGTAGSDFKIENLSIKNSKGNPIASVIALGGTTDMTGGIPIKITPDDSGAYGTGSFKVYKQDSNSSLTIPMLTVNVTITSDSSADNYKLEWNNRPQSADNILDLNNYAANDSFDNEKLGYAVDAYTSSGGYIGALTSGVTYSVPTATKPIVTIANAEATQFAPTYAVNDGTDPGVDAVVVLPYSGDEANQGFYTGTTTLSAEWMVGAVKHKLTKTVTVKNTGATFQAVTFSDFDAADKVMQVSDILDLEDIAINGDAGNTTLGYTAYSLDGDTDNCILVYVDSDNSGTYTEGNDVKVGYIQAKGKDGITPTPTYGGDDTITFDGDTDGTASIGVYKWGSTSAFKSKTIDVTWSI